MRALVTFLKTTVVGGVVFLTPLVILLLVLGKAMAMARGALGPLIDKLPEVHFGGGRVALATLVCAATVLLLCFFAGMMALTRRGTQLGEWVEWRLLAQVPGYSLWRNVARTVAKLESGENASVKVALVEFDGGWRLCFLMETLRDGHVAVFVPDAPSPTTGELHYVPSARVRPLDVGVGAAMGCLKRLGAGSRALLGQASLAPDGGAPPPGTAESVNVRTKEGPTRTFGDEP